MQINCVFNFYPKSRRLLKAIRTTSQNYDCVPSIERIAAEIEKFEGFAVRIRPATKALVTKTNLRSYARSHERIARASFSVADWRRRRFDDVYPDFDVEVLFGDGRPASPRTLLSKIRASYE
jgi:hypothetical protein